jgi:hypothetical protein
MTVLLAEELLLLTLTPKGRPVGGYQYHPLHVAGITGALFIELEQLGCVSFEGRRIQVLDAAPTVGLLADTLEELAPGARVFSQLDRLGAGRWAAVIRKLVDDGVLARRRALLNGYRFPVVDRPLQDGLIGEVRAATSGVVGRHPVGLGSRRRGAADLAPRGPGDRRAGRGGGPPGPG